MRTIHKKAIYFILFYSTSLIFPIVAEFIGPGWPDKLIPPMWIMTLWFVPLILFLQLNNILNKFICLVWLLWFLVGSVNVIASYLKYGEYYFLDVERADFVYIVYSSAFFVSLVIAEKFLGSKSTSRVIKEEISVVAYAGVPSFFAGFLTLFPFVWFFSVYHTVGYIPILQGVDVEREMYELNFGPLYGFAIINVLSMLYFLDKWKTSISRNRKYLFMSLLVVTCLISIMTGKRMFLQIFLLAAFSYYATVSGPSLLKPKFVFSGVTIVLVIYVGILVLRKGLNFSAFEGVEYQLSVVGVEFRDFIYAVNHFTSNDLKDHDWLASTLVSGINSGILGLFGINKHEVLQTALGYVSKPLFMGGVFGVRTGIISELFLAYNYFGLIVIMLFGLIVGWINNKIIVTNSKTSLIFLLSINGIFATAVVAQSIDMVGTVTVLFYAWLLYKVLHLIALKKNYID